VDDAAVRRTRRRLGLGLVVLSAVVVAAALQVPPRDRVPHFAAQDVSVIAHSGAQLYAPTNTLPAFELALEQGADTLEMDLQLTADDEVVVIHDGTVDRTTGASGAVRDLTLAELQELDAGWYFEDEDGSTPYRGQGITIPTLAEVVDAFPDTHLLIELKTDGGPEIVQPVIDLVRDRGIEDRVTIASFSQAYLEPVREQLPGVPTNMPESETFAFYVRSLVGLHPWWEPPGALFQVPETFDGRLVVTPRFTRAAERLGVDVQVWTVNEPEDMHRLLDAGAHAIMTDAPDRLVAVLEERAAREAEDPGGYGDQLERAASLQSGRSAALTPLFVAVTFLGDEEFYLLLLPLLYWAVSRRFGARLGVMLLVTAGLNGVLKLAFATPRPSFLRPELGVVEESTFGLPSGHAQNAAAVWGLVATAARSWVVRGVVLGLIAALGWSRIHLGVHFLEDIVVGWAVGLALLAAFLWLEPRVVAWWRRNATTERVLASVVAGLLFVAPAMLLSGRLVGVRFDWPGLVDVADTIGASHVVTPAATLSGFGIGVALLATRGGFEVAGPIGQRVLRVVVGLVGVLVLWQGLGVVFPGGEEPLALALRAVRYGLVGAWVGGIAPLLFVRLGLAPAGTPSPTGGIAGVNGEQQGDVPHGGRA
jgi:glycerophosphoryl diester phosphodiesterase/membrane-associated phospholipid phosphatase